MNFALQHKGERATTEQLAVVRTAKRLGCDYVFARKCEHGMIPIGDVPFCEAVFGRQPRVKMFYPRFLEQFVSRRIEMYGCERPNDRPFNAPHFVKCATQWKSDEQSRVWPADEGLPAGLSFVSEVVTFVDEWRYYVADGCIGTTGWYSGEHEDAAAPELHIAWPNGFSGAVDFGVLDDGRIELVEAHAPFACGWYGDDPSDYVLWQAIAWEHRDFWLVSEVSK